MYSFPPPTTFPGMLTTGHRRLSTIEQPLPHVSILKCLPASQSGYGQSVILIGTLSVVLFLFSRLLSNNKHKFNPDDAEDIQGTKLSLQITSKDLCQQHRRLYSHGWPKFDLDRPQFSPRDTHNSDYLFEEHLVPHLLQV